MRRLLILGALSMALSATANENADHSEEKKETQVKPVGSDRKSGSVCLVSETALEDLKKAKEDLEAAKKEISLKETELKAKELALTEEMKKIEQIRDSIAKTQESKKKEEAEKEAKLVETIFTMSPKAAAKLLSTLEDDLAVSVMTQMETQRLAKIMNLMDPKRSSNLSEMMAGVVRAKTRALSLRTVASSIDDAATTRQDEKGGEKKDANYEQSHDARLDRTSGKQAGSTSEKK